jgi:MFS family permease
MKTGKLNQVREFLALEPYILSLFVAIFLITLGEQLWVEFLPAYFIALGGSYILLGTFKSFADTLEAISTLPGGMISDKIGRILSAIVFLSMAVLGYITYLFAPSWHFLFLGIILVQGTAGLLQPTVFAFIGDRLPADKRTNAFSVQSILKRLPIVISPAIGGYIIGKYDILDGVRIGLVVSVFLAIIAIGFLVNTRKHIMEKDGNEEVNLSDNELGATQFSEILPNRLRWLLLADSLVRFGKGVVAAFIAIFTIDLVGPERFGILISIQMTVSILSYLPAAWIVERVGRKPVIIVSFICFALMPVLIISSTNFAWLILGFSVAGFREFGEPARKALIVNLSHSELRGKSVGVYYTIRSMAVVPAGILGGIIWTTSPILTGYVGTTVGLLGLLVLIFLVSDTIANADE